MSFKNRFDTEQNKPVKASAALPGALMVSMPSRPKSDPGITPIDDAPDIAEGASVVRDEPTVWAMSYAWSKRCLLELTVLGGVAVVIGWLANKTLALSLLSALGQTVGVVAIGSSGIASGVALAIWFALVWRRPSLGRVRIARKWAWAVLKLAIPVFLLLAWISGSFNGLVIGSGTKTVVLPATLWAIVAAVVGGILAAIWLNVVLGWLMPKEWKE